MGEIHKRSTINFDFADTIAASGFRNGFLACFGVNDARCPVENRATRNNPFDILRLFFIRHLILPMPPYAAFHASDD
jgi:hypothetical protein